MGALDILNAALNETQNSYALPGYCKRVRFRKSNCQKCVEICPENVIALDPGPTIKDGCSDCGLCQRVCPTEVFQNELSTEQDLLNQVKSFLGKEESQPDRNTLFINCHRAENRNEHTLSIPCLGKITENIILGAALLGFDGALLIHGICAKCRYERGMKLFANSILAARVLLESLGVRKFSLNLLEQEKRKEKILSRREIFSDISNEVKRKASSYLCHKEGAFRRKLGSSPERKDGKKGSPRRMLLHALIKQKGWEKSVVLEYRPEFPWGKIRIDEKNCSACGTCIALCPTGSIFSKSEDGYQTFYVNNSLCTDCSLCKEACPRNAIDFEANIPLNDILENEAKVVARVKLTSCVICGEITTAEKGNMCFTCQKRQVWPMHVNA